MDPILEYWPLAATLTLLVASLGALTLLRHLANRESADHEQRLERALRSARRQAARRSRDRWPRSWVRAQMQLAMLLTQAGRENRDRDRLREALVLLAAAIPVLEAKRMSAERATALYYRGRAEWELGMMEPDDTGLETAAATFLHLLPLQPWPRHLSRAIVVTLPAVILADLGQRRGDRAMIEKGVALCREAVTVARRRVAVEWCAAYRNLCHVLTILGRHTSDITLLEEAIAAGREAAAALRQSRDPAQWAASRTYLGRALCTLGELRGDADTVREAVAVLEEVRRANGLAHEGRMVVAQTLGGALIAAGRLTRDRVALRRAVQELIVAQRVFDRMGRSFAHAEAERMAGFALASLGAIENDPAARREAESHYRKALELFSASGATRQTAETETALRDLEMGASGLPAAVFTPLYSVR